jgi:predicted secreted protein
MARPTTANASKLSIWVGTETSPQTFTAPCGLTTRGIQFTSNTNEVQVPDCDDPDAPAWIERAIQTLSASISGSGVLAKEFLTTWQDWYFNAQARDTRIIIDWGAGVTNKYDGRFVLQTFNITGELGGKIQIEISLLNDGQVVTSATP